jgi:hypothetical protein
VNFISQAIGLKVRSSGKRLVRRLAEEVRASGSKRGNYGAGFIHEAS